jgi:hypothetical protein
MIRCTATAMAIVNVDGPSLRRGVHQIITDCYVVGIACG